MKSRRRSVAMASLGLATLCLAVPAVVVMRDASAAAQTEPPNIVFVMVDDLGFDDLDATFMPRSTALMTDLGTQIPFYSMQNCAPSRAALMTGHDPSDIGVTGVDSPATYDGLDPAGVLVAERLQSAGYRTGVFGKWHLGLDPTQNPLQNGFDEFVGFAHGWINSYGSQPGGQPYPDGSMGHDHHGIHDFQFNQVPLYDSTYSTFAFGDAAERFVRSAAGREVPFFAYLPLNAPHGPNSAPREYVELYTDHFGVTPSQLAELHEYADGVLAVPWDSTIDDETRNDLRRLLYFASVRAIDDAVADLHAVLVEEGVADNTLFVFASDNGAGSGSPGSNGILRGHKGTPYEGGHRVANFMIWPGRVAPGHTVNINVWIGDLHETFLAAAGVPLNDPALASNNVLDPLLSGATQFQRKHGGQHILAHASKVVRRGTTEVTAIWAINEASWKYIRTVFLDTDDDQFLMFEEELYDLAADPSETTNLVADPPSSDLIRLRQVYEDNGGDDLLRSWHITEKGWAGFEAPEEWGFGTRSFAPAEKSEVVLAAEGPGSSHHTRTVAPIDDVHSVTFHHPESATRLRVNVAGAGKNNRPQSNAVSGTGYTLELIRRNPNRAWDANLWVNDGSGNSRIVASASRVAWARSTELTLDVEFTASGITGTISPIGRPAKTLTATETAHTGPWLGIETRQVGHGPLVTIAF